jgi:ABC-type transporter Mla MlaB component
MSYVLKLAPDLGIEGAGALQRELLTQIDNPLPLRLDGAEVARVHTSTLQLLCMLWRDRDARGHETRWDAASGVLRGAAQVLGLSAWLQLAATP